MVSARIAGAVLLSWCTVVPASESNLNTRQKTAVFYRPMRLSKAFCPEVLVTTNAATTWTAGVRPDGMVWQIPAFYQTISFKGLDTTLTMALFASEREAAYAAALYTQYGSAFYDRGPLPGTECPGDSCWHSRSYRTLVMQSGRLCVKARGHINETVLPEAISNNVQELAQLFIGHFELIDEPPEGFSTTPRLEFANQNEKVKFSEFMLLASNVPKMELVAEGVMSGLEVFNKSRMILIPCYVQHFSGGAEGFDDIFVMYRTFDSKEEARQVEETLKKERSFADLDEWLAGFDHPKIGSCPGDGCIIMVYSNITQVAIRDDRLVVIVTRSSFRGSTNTAPITSFIEIFRLATKVIEENALRNN